MLWNDFEDTCRGPIDWDLGFQWGPGMAADWDCWSPTGTSDPPVVDVVTCGNLYLEQIRNVSSGVVLMHDPYFINDDPKQGTGCARSSAG